MSASRVVWGQIVVVFAIVLLAVWIATQSVAGRSGFQPQLGAPRFSLASLPIYPPPAFFAWWFFYKAYAPHIFLESAGIAASGGFVAILTSIYRAREAKDVCNDPKSIRAVTNSYQNTKCTFQVFCSR